jgi:hypothetical protein
VTTTLSHPAVPAVPNPERRFAPSDLALLVGVPAGWAALLLFHPTGDGGGFYPTIREELTAWRGVHLAMIAFIPLMAVTVHRLIRGVDNPWARASRLLLPVFAACYLAFEAILGVGTGLLVAELDDLPAEEATATALVEGYTDNPTLSLLEAVAGGSCVVAILAAAVALRRQGTIGWGVVALFAVAAPLIAVHSPPFGPVGLVLFIVGALAVVRSRSRTARP